MEWQHRHIHFFSDFVAPSGGTFLGHFFRKGVQGRLVKTVKSEAPLFSANAQLQVDVAAAHPAKGAHASRCCVNVDAAPTSPIKMVSV